MLAELSASLALPSATHLNPSAVGARFKKALPLVTTPEETGHLRSRPRNQHVQMETSRTHGKRLVAAHLEFLATTRGSSPQDDTAMLSSTFYQIPSSQLNFPYLGIELCDSPLVSTSASLPSLGVVTVFVRITICAVAAARAAGAPWGFPSPLAVLGGGGI